MTGLLGQTVVAGVLSFLIAAQSTAPSKGDHTPASNVPQHSPEQLDFGNAAEGETALRTFSLTTNSSGSVSVTITPGLFHLMEFREIAPVRGKSRGQSGSDVRSRIKYKPDQAGPFQWIMDANVQIQLDIVFSPKPATPVEQSGLMKVSGPGPHGNWAFAVPLRGTVIAGKPSR